jgi:molybdenum cofactor cytidylyltransferase
VTSVAIVPAAGRSDRFGAPKMTAALGGEPLLGRTIRSLLEGQIARVVVVAAATGAFDQLRAMRDPRVSVVINPDRDRGMFSSIQVGLAAADGDPIMVLPGDMPFVQPATVARLLEAYRRTPGFIVPQRHARHGHPIVLPGSIRTAALAASPTSSLNDLIKGQGLVALEVEVDDRGILHDVDTPADLLE